MGNYEEVLEEGRGPRVPRSKGYMVQWSSGCGSRKGNVTCPQGWGGLMRGSGPSVISDGSRRGNVTCHSIIRGGV